MRALAGKPVLIDFWTYSCVNCLRTLPHVRRWHEVYGPLGLTIIGVHTPEFAFERDEKMVANMVDELGVSYPVVLDPDYAVWNLWANRWWPRHFLVNKDGIVTYDHVGEGGYAETERAIQRALMEYGVTELPDIPEDISAAAGVCYKTTPELYLGYLRGHFANVGEFLPDAEEVFTDNAAAHEDDVPSVHGHWRIASDYLEHTKALPTPMDYILLKYSAFGVNLVMGGKGTIEVELDGLPITQDMAGADVEYKGGKAIVQVRMPRMYEIVRADVYHRATLKLRTADADIRMFAFTFNGCG